MPIFWEIVAGSLAGFFVSPINTIVDKSVIENANGKIPLWQGVGKGFKNLFLQPHVFMKSFEFKWILFVYTTTYASSNIADHMEISGVDPAIIKLTVSFLVNTVASLMKDKAFTQTFGTQKIKSFPMTSYAFLLSRDIVGMASAFTIPPIIGRYLSKKFNLNEKDGLRAGQLISPLIIQFIATPLHLFGLDYYNRENLAFMKRMQYIGSIYWNTVLLRMMRFLPAYGLGGIANI